LTGPWGILTLILAVQTVANIGPIGLPAIAPLIRDDLRLSLTQAGSFLSAYYVGPMLLSDRLFGGRRRIVLFLAGTGSMICSVAIAG